MITLHQYQVDQIIKNTNSKIGEKYDKGYNCENFVFDVYNQIGIVCQYSDFPCISLEEVLKGQWVGYLLFLKHKRYGEERRFTHVGILMPNQHLIHYSRYFGEPNVREVFLTPLSKIFEVYEFVQPTVKALPPV